MRSARSSRSAADRTCPRIHWPRGQSARRNRRTRPSWFDLVDVCRGERFQVLAGGVEIEARIRRLDAEEKAASAGELEARDVEQRMMRRRQAVRREHPDHCGESRKEDRA